MWVRDALLTAFLSIRAIIYGYDLKLVGSNLFQTIADVASFFVGSMKASGCGLPSVKPLIFLAHSLGGIVLKEALDRDPQILQHVVSAVLTVHVAFPRSCRGPRIRSPAALG
jgi:hypothetical protein